MTQSDGNGPPQDGADPPLGAQTSAARLKRRAKNWLTDWGTFFVVGLPVAFVFEHVASTEGLARALNFEEELYDAVRDLSPLGLLNHLIDFHLSLVWAVTQFLDTFLPHFIVALLTPVLMLLLGALVLGLTPIALPILVVVDGNLLELFMVAIVFVPLVAALRELGAAGVLAALAVTMLFFGLVQLAMIAALFVFGEILSMAASLVASSAVASGAFWCLSKGAEHSLSERILNRARAAMVAWAGRLPRRLS